jgi:3',5'-cyclic AMP phosphodiesterase CpdA
VLRLLHFSDLHLGAPVGELPASDLAPKRVLGAANLWLRRERRFRDAPEKIAALASLAAREQVDAVLCTGDYTALGSVAELAAARRAIAPLTARPGGFVTVPGNHDVYVETGTLERRFEQAFAGLLESDVPELAVDGSWPLVRLFGDDVAIVCVNSARPNPQLWRSSGQVPTAQLAALRRALDDARLRDRFVLVATHYAPLRADGRADAAWHGLVNGEALLAAIGPRPRTALVHGHLHRAFALAATAQRPPIFCAGSATDTHGGSCWLYELERTSLRAIPATWRAGQYVLDRAAPTLLGA